MYPRDFLKLINFLRKLSGVGAKTAQRFAFELLTWKESELEEISYLFRNLKKNVQSCKTCGCLISDNFCRFCDPNLRDITKLCIVSSFKDVFLIENTKYFKGFYHIINTLLSPIDGKEIDSENLICLKNRIKEYQIKEIIIALESTLEGDATSLYLKEELKDLNVNIFRLAFGLPIGISLDYIDEGTLTQALIGRQIF